MSMFRKKDEGFTLVELMVVVLIIGILVAIAIPVFNAARGNAQQRACFANQRTIEGAVQQAVATNVGLQPADVSVAMLTGTADFTGYLPVLQTYIADPPGCPANNNAAYTLTGGVTGCPGGTTDHGRYTGATP